VSDRRHENGFGDSRDARISGRKPCLRRANRGTPVRAVRDLRDATHDRGRIVPGGIAEAERVRDSIVAAQAVVPG